MTIDVDDDACPKCGATSGGDWSQCEGRCPMPESPHFSPTGRHAYTHLVVIVREGVPSVTPFEDLETARAFHEEAGAQWSESYLTAILKGPYV